MYKTIYFYKLDIAKCMQFDGNYRYPAYYSELEYYGIFDKRFNDSKIKRNIDSDGSDYLSCFISSNIVVDILEHNQIYLFGTIGSTKNENKLRRLRNKNDLSHAQLVIDPDSILEDYTYFYLEYSSGIISVINSRGAPDIKLLKKLLDIYSYLEPSIYPIKNCNINKVLDKIVDIEGVSLQFALPPDELLGPGGENVSMKIINQFKEDGFERCDIRFRLETGNPKRKNPKEIINHIKETYELVREKENRNIYKLEKLDIIATQEEERQQVINILELNYTKGINIKVDDNFSESIIKEQLSLVYNTLKVELQNSIELHVQTR